MSVKFVCPQFWGRISGCADLYGLLEKCVLSAGKPMSIKFLVLGGGGYFGLGGREVPILFLWVRGFSLIKGRSLKGIFDKACPLTCRFLCRSLSHPPPSPSSSPFSLIFQGKKNPPPPPPSTRPQTPYPGGLSNRNCHPFAKTTPGT